MLIFLLATAHAASFGQAKLIDGKPDDDGFQSCISGGSCADTFYGFLTGGMLEQGFAMQDHSLLTNPLVNRKKGWLVGGALSTFPFGEPEKNLSGKEENTSFSPVFPKIRAGYTGKGKHRHGLGFSFTPPVPVQGAAALALGVDAGLAFSPAKAASWGVHGDLSFVNANAPVTATDEQLEESESFENSDNLDAEQFEEVCGDEGCIDTFTQVALAGRFGRSWVAGSSFTPYAQVGLSAIYARLHVMYDDTTWAVTALQPTVHAGSGWAPGDHVQLALGGSAGLQMRNQQRDGEFGVFWRLEGAAAYVF
jgi:hypothetical protein